MAFEPVSMLGELVLASVWATGSGLLSRMKLTDTVRQQVYNATRQYIKNYSERHGTLKVLAMREPVSLDSIYTTVQFLGEDIRQFESLEKLEMLYRRVRQRRFQLTKKPKQDGMKVANEKQFLMVLGQPGAGKSTFLRRIGLEALRTNQGEYHHKCIPVFIELKKFTTTTIDLGKTIEEEFRLCGFPKPAESVNKLLQAGKLLILLDGLDEVPDNALNYVITHIHDFVDLHDKNRFIASCRTAAYRSSFKRFADVIMSDFDDHQIQKFIFNWFQSDNDKRINTARTCWELLQKPEYHATREIAQTPLLLTLLCLVFDDSQSFPINRASLYGEALNVLLKRWSSEKRIYREPIYQDLSIQLEEVMLAEMAFKSFRVNQLFFTRQELCTYIQEFLSKNLNAPQHLDSESIAEAIEIQQGIIVERANGILSFSHLTLQEYLTARHIVNHNAIPHLVKMYATDERWREIFLLVSGLLTQGSDSLLFQLDAEAQRLLNTDRLQSLIHWLNHRTSHIGNHNKPTVARIAALLFARVRAHTLAFEKLNPLDDNSTAIIDNKNLMLEWRRMRELIRLLSVDLKLALPQSSHYTDIYMAYHLSELRIFGEIKFDLLLHQLLMLKKSVYDPEERRKRSNQLRQKVIQMLNYNPEWDTLLPEEVANLEKYLYLNEMLIRCKQAAIKVSPRTWQRIENNMLTVQQHNL
jgi:GTPase SAR1 family protein